MKITQADGENIHLVQITDTHISTDIDEKFEGIDTTASLGRVIDKINALDTVPDAILLTGDLVHHADEAGYRKLLRQLFELKAPVFCLPGNHDDPVLMQTVLNNKNVSTEKSLDFNQWIVVMLNTWMPNSHSGRLPRTELTYLEQVLGDNADKSILVCLHHPPVKIGSPWMDAMMLENPESLFDIVDTKKQVRGILWGHIHQAFYLERGDIKLLGSPSTCVQFKPDTRQFMKDTLPPAFRLLTLRSTGEIESRINWV